MWTNSVSSVVKISRTARFGIFVLVALFVAPGAVQAQTNYTFTKIADTTGGNGVTCVNIGNSGTVIWTRGGELWRGDGQSNPSQVTANGLGLCGSINDQDEIAYTTYNPPSTVPNYLVRNSNGTLTTLAQSYSSPFLHSGRTYLPSLANNGSAVFHGGPSTACGNPSTLSGYGIYVGPSGPTVYDPICDSAADIYESSVVAGTMNNNLVVAFFAQTKTGTQGVYRGSLTPLVQDGSNGVSLAFARPVMNNSGTVAFLASINGGPASIYTTSDGVSFTPVGQYPNNTGEFAINDSGKVAYTRSSGIYTGVDLVADKVIEPGDPLDGSTFQGGFSYLESFNNNGQVAFLAFLADGRIGVYRANPITDGCATDISAIVAVSSQGPVKLNKKTGRYTQSLTLKNGDGAVSGPVSLVLDSLSSNATLFNSTGTTACAAPSGSPYINVNIGSDSVFSPRERGTVTLEFTDPSGQAVTYTPRVLAGAGNR